MTVKTGSAWAGTFVTLDATGALATPSSGPAGVLYVDGTANAATVTITGSNPYKWAVTLPSLTAGQRVDMYITGTIATIATAGFVASAQADTALLSEVKTDTAAILADTGTDGVVLKAAGLAEDAVTEIQNGLATPTNITAGTITTVTNLTNLPTMPADWVTAAGVKADAVTKIQLGLALEATLTAIKGAGWTNETLAALKTYVDEIETRLTAARAGYLDKLNVTGTLAHSNDAATYKADVSGLMAAAAYTAPDNAGITAIKNKTDNLPALPAPAGEYDADFTQVVELLYSIMGGEAWSDETLVSIKAAIDALNTNSVMDVAVDGEFTFKEVVQIIAAVLAGILTRTGNSLAFRDLSDTLDRVVVETDENKQRTGATYTV